MHDDEVCLAFRSNRFEELLAESGNDVNMIIYLFAWHCYIEQQKE